MEQVHMEYRERVVWKVNKFNFLNEKVEKFTSRWGKNLLNVRSANYLKQKMFLALLMHSQVIHRNNLTLSRIKLPLDLNQARNYT